MKAKTFLLTGLAACLIGASGCSGPGQNTLLGRIENPLKAAGAIQSQERKTIPITRDSIHYLRFDFDDAFESARKIKYKSEPGFSDYMQTPLETARLGTGDCEDFAVYLSNLLTNQGIKNEIVFGQVHSSDGLSLHVWNRVIENGNRYLLDSVAGTRLLESEIPAGYYKEYSSIKPKGYSRLEVAGYSLKSKADEILPIARNAITGDPKKRIIGGEK